MYEVTVTSAKLQKITGSMKKSTKTSAKKKIQVDHKNIYNWSIRFTVKKKMSDMEEKILCILDKPVLEVTREELAILADYNQKQKLVSSVLTLNREIETTKATAMHKESIYAYVRVLIAKYFVLGVTFTNQPMIDEVCFHSVFYDFFVEH